MPAQRNVLKGGKIACGTCAACARVIVAWAENEVRCGCGASALAVRDGKIWKHGRVQGERWA